MGIDAKIKKKSPRGKPEKVGLGRADTVGNHPVSEITNPTSNDAQLAKEMLDNAPLTMRSKFNITPIVMKFKHDITDDIVQFHRTRDGGTILKQLEDAIEESMLEQEKKIVEFAISATRNRMKEERK